MTLRAANAIVRRLQRLLRLEDWKIRVKLCPVEEIMEDGSGRMADCNFDSPERIAIIRVPRDTSQFPEEFRRSLEEVYGYPGGIYPPEELLVHEVLHILIDGYAKTAEGRERIVRVLTPIISGLIQERKRR